MSSISASRFRWDVFLSFRGEDTRGNFTNQLYCKLEQKGIRVFRDNDGMTQGDSLDPKLFEAIEDSAASIAIISPKYASSRWCLEELAKIWECNRLILPVFYLVDPSDVRRQAGPYFKDYFEVHKERFGDEMVSRWKNAMTNVGRIIGWVFHEHWDQQELISKIVKKVWDALSNNPFLVSPYTVGLDFPLEELMNWLDVKCKGIQVLGLHGMGGIGKTTLSKALYNKLVGQIEHRSFISDVRETCSKQDGVLDLQRKLIQDLSSTTRVPPVKDVDAGLSAIKRIVHDKKVLIVLDDIDDVSQLNALAGERDWFYEGSRIIITTRDENVLSTQFVTKVHEVKELGESDSIKLFSYHALRREKPTSEFYNLSKQFVSLTGKLPLALEVFGSFLLDKRSLKEWNDALQKLKKIRPSNLQDVLMISFNSLDEQEKCIFLDIACLFLNLGMRIGEVFDVIKGCGFNAETALGLLVKRSLVKVDENDGSLRMHDQIRDMGRQIVLTENLDPGLRSRLWDLDEIFGVLHVGKGTRSIQGITLNVKTKSSPNDANTEFIRRIKSNKASALISYMKEMYRHYFQHGAEEENEKGVVYTTQFKPMVNLRLLQLGDVKLKGDLRHLPSEMKWLQWKECPLKCLPYIPPKLHVLDLSRSKIERVWGWHGNKVAKNLVVLNLYNCYNLTALPDLSEHPCLEKLNLELCTKLTTIHKSVGDLNLLQVMNLRGCKVLAEFPSDVSGLKSLDTLILSDCQQLRQLPENTGSMISLRQLLLDNTAVEKLPESIFRLTKLETLNLNNCNSLKQLPVEIRNLNSLKEISLNDSTLEALPDSIGELNNLEKLSLMWCTSLKVIPDSIRNLKSLTELRLSYSSVKELPDSIGSLHYLNCLSIANCSNITTLPVSIKMLASMVELDLDGTSIKNLPKEIGGLKSLKKFEMRNCKFLTTLPDTIGELLALNTLIILNAAIVELPEQIGNLEDLIMLNLNKCRLLYKLPDSFGKLKNLHHLHMEETAVTELPENFGMLSRLMTLKMAKKTDQEVSKNPRLIELPSSFSNLSMLNEFDARRWKISGKISDDFEKLTSLKFLKMDANDFCSLPSSLRGLSSLTKLWLPNCNKLKVLPPLPSSLELLNAANCTELESISDLSNLESLTSLDLTNCNKLVDIPGLECLKSLRRFYAGGCNLCSLSVKRKLSKVAIRNLFNLSMPGSEIPNWFTPKEVVYSERRNNGIKAVIFAVVVSINHQISDVNIYQVPGIVSIQAKLLRSDIPVCTSTLKLDGVPNTDEDQVYFCRYQEYEGLFLMLKDGDKIQLSMWDTVFSKGIELKKCGIHLVYENDDDYGGDEDLLNKGQQSVSQKLKGFLDSSKEEVELLPGSSEVESEVHNRESKEKQGVFPLILSCFIVLLSGVVFAFVAR